MAINDTFDKLDRLKLTKTQELLLKKLVDFSTMQNYDIEQIKSSLYKLFFDWSQEMGGKHKDKKEGSGEKDGDEQSQQADVDEEMDKEEKKKRQQLRLD